MFTLFPLVYFCCCSTQDNKLPSLKLDKVVLLIQLTKLLSVAFGRTDTHSIHYHWETPQAWLVLPDNLHFFHIKEYGPAAACGQFVRMKQQQDNDGAQGETIASKQTAAVKIIDTSLWMPDSPVFHISDPLCYEFLGARQ